MSTTINDSMDTVKDMMNNAKEGTEHAVSSTRSVLFDGLRAAAGVVSILRSFGVGDALGWFGLARRRSPVSAIATFGAGVAVGTGLGMLLAPMSGSDTRRMIGKGITSMFGDAGRAAHKVEATLEKGEKAAVAKVEEIASKVKTMAVKTEHGIEDAVTGRTDATKEPTARGTDATKEPTARGTDASKESPARATGPVAGGNHRPA